MLSQSDFLFKYSLLVFCIYLIIMFHVHASLGSAPRPSYPTGSPDTEEKQLPKDYWKRENAGTQDFLKSLPKSNHGGV